MPKPPAKCGTPSGYNRHLRLGEAPCIPCTEAKTAWNRMNLAADPERARLQADRTLAHGRALGRLRDLYPEVYQTLFREELAKVERSSNPGH